MSPVVALTVFLSCSAERQAIRHTHTENELLARSAEIYWKAVRWQDEEAAGKFVQDPDDRFALQEWMTSLHSEWRLVDIKILRIEVTDALTGNESPRTRQGTVHIRTEAYTLPGQVLKTQTIRQEWYRVFNGWFIDWNESGPLGETDKFRSE